jgi:hypothetical protein
MGYMTHKDNGQESDPQAGHKMSEIHATHVRQPTFNTGLGTQHPRFPAQNSFPPSSERLFLFMEASFSSTGHGVNLPIASQYDDS